MDYDSDNSHVTKNCGTCKNNAEYPLPHTFDIYDSLDEELYCIWESKEQMRFRKSYDGLRIDSYIYFEDARYCFCGFPWVNLVTWKSKNQIGINICDKDDFTMGLVYYPKTEDEFFNVLHELINWMRDHEQGVSDFDKLIHDMFNFFPDCGCDRKWW